MIKEATVQVSLITRTNTIPLTNTSPLSSEASDGSFPITNLINNFNGLTSKSSDTQDWILTKFEPTPKVSTYLVAWANGI